ncbi:MAG: DUF2232 domain-containing protein [Bacteriovoracaceae bacterium]
MTENMDHINSGMQDNKGFSRFLFLGLASIVLCISVFMSVFTPVPLVFAIIMYGRLKGLALGLVGLLIAALLSQFLFPKELLVFLYAGALVMAFAIAEIWFRRMAPFQGIVRFGMGFLLLISVAIGVSSQLMTKPLRFYIVEEVKQISTQIQTDREKILAEGGEESRAMVDLFSSPEKMADEVIFTFPSAIFMVIFFGMWINLLIIIRGQSLLFGNKLYPYTEKDFLSFAMPDMMVWLVIPALVLTIWGKEYLGTWYEVGGLTALKCLGLFYFFQGFGIYMDFVAFLRITGFFRTFLILFTVVTASWLIAIIGLFDIWVNFRKFFKKNNRNDEGELP